MSKGEGVSIKWDLGGAAFWIGFWLTAILCSGDPDLVDAIIGWLQRRP